MKLSSTIRAWSDPQLASLLDVRPSRLAGALAQLNRGEDKERIAAAVARFYEATKKDESADGNTIGALLGEANRGELLVRIPVYTGAEGELTSNVALVTRLDDGTLPTPQFHNELHLSGRGPSSSSTGTRPPSSPYAAGPMRISARTTTDTRPS